MPETMYVHHPRGTYKAYWGLGENGKSSWYVMFLDAQGNARDVDGNTRYDHRQNAYRRAKQLNDGIPADHDNWYYVDQKDGSCGQYVLTTNKIDAIRQVAQSYGMPQKGFRVRECNPPDEPDNHE